MIFKLVGALESDWLGSKASSSAGVISNRGRSIASDVEESRPYPQREVQRYRSYKITGFVELMRIQIHMEKIRTDFFV
jgi:hypothetical protein